MKTLRFNLSGTFEVPDDIVLREDILNKLYAFELNNKMYMLQMCFVAESSDGEYEMVHQYDEMVEHGIENVRYIDAEFEEVK
jgi:hypothetical protein